MVTGVNILLQELGLHIFKIFFPINHAHFYPIFFSKRAQLPFSAWLPAAIAAPIPVSSLVQSSTLVKAGIYLMIHLSPSFEERGCCLLIIIGGLTSFFSGLAAFGENDLKRVITLSTLSQLGVIIFFLGLGLMLFCYFRLFAHALFKALLSICSGVVIHSLGVQDIPRLRGVSKILPYTSYIFLVGSLRLMGFPFLLGFSKRFNYRILRGPRHINR